VPASLDLPHSWTSISDVAATLVTAGSTERAWGQAWLVPTNPPLTIREISARFTAQVSAPAPRLTSLPYPVLWTSGLFSATLRELRTTNYQWARPFVMDSAQTEQALGLTPTPIDQALAAIQSPA
ncbi:MAG TPA: NAD-dependent epimerase, partial [Streptosporangiaceae bacterium]